MLYTHCISIALRTTSWPREMHFRFLVNSQIMERPRVDKDVYRIAYRHYERLRTRSPSLSGVYTFDGQFLTGGSRDGCARAHPAINIGC